MGDRKIITADEFCDAWCSTWKTKDKDQSLSDQFTGDGTWGKWTERMLAGDNSFLVCVVKKLMGACPYKYVHEGGIHVDMCVVADKDKGYPNSGYPYLWDILIEHENDKRPENEMWKLMLLRSPLKVIIFYDHCKVDLSEKLTELREMLKKANAAFPENKKTEYLFIIGAGEVKGEPLKWRRASHRKLSLRNLC